MKISQEFSILKPIKSPPNLFVIQRCLNTKLESLQTIYKNAFNFEF